MDVINTYRDNVRLFIGGDILLSQEGITQGDPLAMAIAMHAVAINPLSRCLEDDETKQAWFADDATAGGSLTGLKRWWDRIAERGPAYGYHPNPTKTSLVVKEENVETAKEVFQGTGISITGDGKRHLGASCYWNPVLC